MFVQRRLRMEERASGQAHSCGWMRSRDLAQRVRAGEILVGPVDGESPHPVPRGLIHDWIGAVFVPKAKLDDVMGVLDDYEHYKDFYRPMVVKARLLERTPDHEKVTLRMMEKAYSVTGAVETDDEVKIARLGADRAYSLSTSVRVQDDSRLWGTQRAYASGGPRARLRLADVQRNAARTARRRSVRGDGNDRPEPRHPVGVSLAGCSRWRNACPGTCWGRRLRTRGTP